MKKDLFLSKPYRILPTAALVGLLSSTPFTTQALTFVLPHNGNIVGHLQRATVQRGDSLVSIGRRYDIGAYEMIEANPTVSYDRPKVGTTVLIPSRFILPDAPRQGIVINLAEMRLYYYHKDGVSVSTYPVGIGQDEWETPLGKTQITTKRKDPTWHVPESIIENYRKHGKTIEKVRPPGPDNPLGAYAMNIGFKNIVIHGTPYPDGVGLKSSRGCIRMLNEDVGALFQMVDIGTSVTIIHQPTKIGRSEDRLYLEAHKPASRSFTYAAHPEITALIQKIAQKGGLEYRVQWEMIDKLQRASRGYPQPIGALVPKIP